MAKVFYEWDVEEVDDEDIIDHWHQDTYAECVTTQSELQSKGFQTRICLVRDVTDVDDGLQDRQWAYVEDGKLSEFFEDAGGYDAKRVPQRFHKEVADVS